MAFKVNFFDNTDHDYYASDYNKQFESIVGVNGVVDAGDFLVTQTNPASMNIEIAKGSAWINGQFIVSDAVENITITLNSSSTARVEYIVLEIDSQNKSASLKKVVTTTSSQIVLAKITMTNSNTSVTSNQIVDMRTFAKTNLIGDVELAKNSEKLGGQLPSYYLNTTSPSSYFAYNGTTGRVTHGGNDVTVLTAVKWNGYAIWEGTAAQYNAITTKDSKTLYCIKE